MVHAGLRLGCTRPGCPEGARRRARARGRDEHPERVHRHPARPRPSRLGARERDDELEHDQPRRRARRARALRDGRRRGAASSGRTASGSSARRRLRSAVLAPRRRPGTCRRHRCSSASSDRIRGRSRRLRQLSAPVTEPFRTAERPENGTVGLSFVVRRLAHALLACPCARAPRDRACAARRRGRRHARRQERHRAPRGSPASRSSSSTAPRSVTSRPGPPISSTRSSSTTRTTRQRHRGQPDERRAGTHAHDPSPMTRRRARRQRLPLPGCRQHRTRSGCTARASTSFAVGKGTVCSQGSPDSSGADGRYSLNGDDWHSLPAVPTNLLSVAPSG